MSKKCNPSHQSYGDNSILQPWQDESGNTFTTEILREKSRAWDRETWEKYLQTLERPQTETISSKFEALLFHHDSKMAVDNFNGESQSTIQVTSEQLQQIIGRLTDKQQLIIRLHLWEGKSFTDISKQLEISKPAAWGMYQRALKGLRVLLHA